MVQLIIREWISKIQIYNNKYIYNSSLYTGIIKNKPMDKHRNQHMKRC